MDSKAWRRSVMSDEEATGLFGLKTNAHEAMGAVLDEFVRRLGEMRMGRIQDDSVCHNKFHEFTYQCDDEPRCRPAVLFVQGEKLKVEECPCRNADSEGGCCRFKANKPNCCICHCACHEDSMPCLKCGRQPDGKVQKSPEERILEAKRLYGAVWIDHMLIQVLRGEDR